MKPNRSIDNVSNEFHGAVNQIKDADVTQKMVYIYFKQPINNDIWNAIQNGNRQYFINNFLTHNIKSTNFTGQYTIIIEAENFSQKLEITMNKGD